MSTSLGTKIAEILNGTLRAISTVIPVSVAPDKPTLVSAPIIQLEMGVLIGITGDVKGRLVIEGPSKVFTSIGEIMFGMPLEGEMLESFAGELGNMIAGNMCTNVFNGGVTIDITPPTVLVGETKLSGFDKALQVPIQIDGKGSLRAILMLEDQ